ncbi:MAG: hypothetical protein Q4E10_01755 [Porphyromonas sp.]|nr:hypothetical protein [Porphyromonas sp.]
MDNSEFQHHKQQFMQGLWPQKSIELSEVLHVGDNVFSIGGLDIEAFDRFTKSYDQIIGINSQQRDMVKEASGENGLTNYRNYINVASNIQKSRSVLVIASPDSCQLAEIIPIVEEYISPSLFFDFAEMMAEESGYTITDIMYDNHHHLCITVTFTNPSGDTHNFGLEEEFKMDGFFLQWSPSQIELGHYYERLVCANGSTVRDKRKEYTTYKLSSTEIRQMMERVKNRQFLTYGIEHFGRLLTRASESRMSVAEMFKAKKLLIANGVQEEYAENLIPYMEVRGSYESAGYYNPTKERMMKGEGTIWDTYNLLTKFATHDRTWQQQDHRRINVMNGAFKLLQKEPDIVNYIDVFQ